MYGSLGWMNGRRTGWRTEGRDNKRKVRPRVKYGEHKRIVRLNEYLLGRRDGIAVALGSTAEPLDSLLSAVATPRGH